LSSFALSEKKKKKKRFAYPRRAAGKDGPLLYTPFNPVSIVKGFICRVEEELCMQVAGSLSLLLLNFFFDVIEYIY